MPINYGNPLFPREFKGNPPTRLIFDPSRLLLYPVTVSGRLWIWVRGTGWMFFFLSCTIKVIILPPICAFTTLTFSHFFLLNANIVVINVKFKFTYSKGWQLVSVIEIFQSMSLYSCCFLCARFNDASIMCEKFPFPTEACLPLTEFENVGNICFWEPDFACY